MGLECLMVWFVLWVWFVKVAVQQCLLNSPFKTFGCLGLWVLLWVLLLFGLGLGLFVWAHGFGMSDGLVCALGWVGQSCV